LILVVPRTASDPGLTTDPVDKCKKCKACITTFGCPAIYLDLNGNVAINEAVCLGCGYCIQVCPFDAIGPRGESQ